MSHSFTLEESPGRDQKFPTRQEKLEAQRPSAGLGGANRLEEIGSRSRHPRTNGADRAAEYLGSLVVRQPELLREDERLATAGLEVLDEFIERTVNCWCRGVGCRHPSDAIDQTALTLGSTHRIGAHMPRDRKEPGANRCFAAIRVDGAQRSLVGFLHQVGWLGRRAERLTQPPDRWLRCTDEFGHGPIIALTRRVEQRAKRILRRHVHILSGVGN